MPSSPLRGVLIGAGFFAAFQAEAWRRVDGARLTAVADLDRDRAETFARRWEIPRVYTDPAAMLAAERPDFVDIATRPETHRALVALAAAHGAHVICQKPLAPTWDDCLAMIESCHAAGVRLLVHENWRWQPWYRELRRLLEAGAFGTPHYLGFVMRTADGRGPAPYPVQPYFRDMERFLLQETVVHFLDTFRYLLGEFASLSCRTARLNPVVRGEDACLLQVDFISGALGLIDANRISGPDPSPVTIGTLRLEGDRAMARLDGDGRLWLTEYGSAEREHAFPTSNEGYKGDSVRALQQHLVDCLRAGTPAEPEAQAYLPTLAAVFAAYQSAETGCPVTLAGKAVSGE